jgi:hypothetical protein
MDLLALIASRDLYLPAVSGAPPNPSASFAAPRRHRRCGAPVKRCTAPPLPADRSCSPPNDEFQ